MIDVFVVPDVAGQTVTVTGTIAAERFVLSTKFGSFYSIVLKAQGGADEIPKFTLGGSAVLDMGDGNDKVQLETEALDAALGSGNDELRGYGGNGCVIDAGPGDDTVRCAGDSVQIDGGTGDDTLIAAAPQAGFLIKGGPGNDKLFAERHVDGGEAYGDAGNDLIEINLEDTDGGSPVSLYGGDGNDTLRVKNQSSDGYPVELWGGAGLDKISCGGMADQVRFKPTDSLAGSKRDIVYKFADGIDKIVPEGDANRNQSGVQDYQFVGQTKKPGAGKIGWYSTAGGPVIIGSDGRTVFEIKLDKFAGTLDPSDFVF
jgi:hypothetical protein